MINDLIATDLLENTELFNIFVFFILLVFAYLIAKTMHISDTKSILALHSFLILIFIFMELIDYVFIIFAVIELVLLFNIKMVKRNDEIE